MSIVKYIYRATFGNLFCGMCANDHLLCGPDNIAETIPLEGREVTCEGCGEEI